MAEKTKQHYVPRFYLRNFAKGKVFNLYNLKLDEIKKKIPFAGQCYKSNFYGRDKVYEKELSKLETCWGAAITRILNNVKSISREDENLLKQFCCFQQLRTEAAFLRTRNMYYEVTRQVLPLVAQAEKLDISKEQIDKFAYNYAQMVESKEDTIKMQIDVAKMHYKLLGNLQITILENDTDLEFIVNDNPIIMRNEYQHDDVGFDCIGLCLLFPLSPKYYAVISDTKIFFKLRNISTLSVDKRTVKKLNILQYQHSLENVFSQTDDGVDFIKEYIKNQSILVREGFIENYNRTKNNFLSINEKVSTNQIFREIVPSEDAILWKLMCKGKLENQDFDFLEIHNLAKPFANKINYNFHRSADTKAMNDRLMLMSIATSEILPVNVRGSKKEIDEEALRLKLFSEFLNKYFKNEL